MFLVDPIEILAGKLFSRREKDLDDLRSILPNVVKDAFESRLRSAGGSLYSDLALRQNAEGNWYNLFGTQLAPF